MVVAVIAVGVVQVTVHQVADVVPMGNSRVPAVGSVNMVGVVASTVVLPASIRVLVRDFNYMLVVVVFMGTVEVSVVKVAHVIAMLNRDMAAVRTVGVVMVFVNLMRHWVVLL